MRASASARVIEQTFRRDRVIVWLGIGALCLFAWQRTVQHSLMIPVGDSEWNPAGFLSLAIMWVVMMMAMMVPTAAPAVLTYAAVSRKRAREGGAALPTGFFLLGYVLAWSLFSVAAAGLQSILQGTAAVGPGMALVNPYVASGVLVLAGIFQWSRLKAACLRHCRSPASFLGEYWREGTAGAVELGLRHGVYCIGCCWALMGVLFVTGVMHLGWMAVLTVLMLGEKALPTRPARALKHMTGIVLLAVAVLILV